MIAQALTGGATLGLEEVWSLLEPWEAFLAESAFITAAFGGPIWLVEREPRRAGWRTVRGLARRTPGSDPS